MELLEDNYYSDDELNETIKNPHKFVVFSNHRIEIEDRLDDIDHVKSKPSTELIMIEAYDELKQYAHENGLEIIDQCSLLQFEELLKQYEINY